MKQQTATQRDNTPSQFNPFDLLVDTEDHLRFMERLIARIDSTLDTHAALSEGIAQVRQRSAAATLNMAVIGEFDSGKTTFINALLRDELLKTSVNVTTTAVTHLRYGDGVDLIVRFKGRSQELYYSNNAAQLWQAVSQHATSPPAGRQHVRSCIELVTADERVSPHLDSITITHPSAFLKGGTVIIDTPGTNAERHHEDITCHVVERQADAAIIIVPAPYPISTTLTSFLDSHLRPYLHRCLFVVTQLDKIRERERDRLLETIRARLVSLLRLISPPLYATAPARVLEEHSGSGRAAGPWTAQFLELERAIYLQLQRGRNLIIAESLLRLLDNLFYQLQTYLEKQWTSHKQRQAAIERDTITDLAAFAALHRNQCSENIDDARAGTLSRIDKSVSKCRNKVKSRIQEAVSGASNETLEHIVGSRAGEILQGEIDQLLQEVQKQLQQLGKAAHQAQQYFNERFANEYRKLQALGSQVAIPATENVTRGIQVDIPQVFSPVRQLLEELDTQEFKRTGGGALAGAALGAVAGGPVGALIGAIIGGFIGNDAGPSLKERKQQLWSRLSSQLDNTFAGIDRQATWALDSYDSTVRSLLDTHVQCYITTYGDAVKAMRAKQEAELRRLQKLQADVATDLKEIERRRVGVQHKQESLAAL